MKYQSTPPGLTRHAAVVAAVVFSLCVCSAGVRAQDIRVTIDGNQVEFQDIGPQQISGRTMVPVRGVLEKLGANVSYNSPGLINKA